MTIARSDMPQRANDPPAALPPEDQRTTAIALRGGYVAEAVDSAEATVLHVRAPTGRAILTMRLTAEGPVLELEGVSLSIAAHGDLKLSADRLAITTRGDAEITCGGNLTLRAEGDLHAEGADHTIVATRGDVSVRANDDVRLDGERIALNSPDPPPGPHVLSPHRLAPSGG